MCTRVRVMDGDDPRSRTLGIPATARGLRCRSLIPSRRRASRPAVRSCVLQVGAKPCCGRNRRQREPPSSKSTPRCRYRLSIEGVADTDRAPSIARVRVADFDQMTTEAASWECGIISHGSRPGGSRQGNAVGGSVGAGGRGSARSTGLRRCGHGVDACRTAECARRRRTPGGRCQHQSSVRLRSSDGGEAVR